MYIPAGIYLLKFNNRNTRKRCEIFSKLTIKIPERCQCQTIPFSRVSIVDFEHVIAGWDRTIPMQVVFKFTVSIRLLNIVFVSTLDIRCATLTFPGLLFLLYIVLKMFQRH